MNYYVATWRLLSNFSSSVEKYFKSECCEWVKYFYSRTYTCYIIKCYVMFWLQFKLEFWVFYVVNKYVCHYQEKTFFVFFSLFISCLSFQMNINPPKMPFKIVTGQGHKIINHRIQSVLYIFMCLKYWICQRESIWYSQIMTLSFLDVKYKFSLWIFYFCTSKICTFQKRFKWLQLCSSILTGEFNKLASFS